MIKKKAASRTRLHRKIGIPQFNALFCLWAMRSILWATRPHLGATRPRVGILVGRHLLNAIQRIEIQTFNLRKLTMFVYANNASSG